MHQVIIILSFLIISSAACASGYNFLKNSPIAVFKKEDLSLMEKNIYKALDVVKDGETLSWENTKTGSSGVARPVKTFKYKSMDCRSLEIINRSKKATGESKFNFCKIKDNSWKIITEKIN